MMMELVFLMELVVLVIYVCFGGWSFEQHPSSSPSNFSSSLPFDQKIVNTHGREYVFGSVICEGELLSVIVLSFQ